MSCHRFKHYSSSDSFPVSILFSSLLVPMSNVFVCAYECMCVSVPVFFFFWAFVSPYWQRGITAPGIESSSQAFGWRSTLKMKRMLVHLKVAAEEPVDVFAVDLSVTFNSGWFGFHFHGFLQNECGFLFVFALSVAVVFF